MESGVQFISVIAIIIGWGIALHIAIIRRIKAMESRLIAEFNERDGRLIAELRAMESRLTGELRTMGRKRDTLVSEVKEVKGAVGALVADRRPEPVEKP